MIKIFNNDYMHAVILSVTKIFTNLYRKYYIKCYHKLSKSYIIHINKRLSIFERKFVFVKYNHWITLKGVRQPNSGKFYFKLIKLYLKIF